MQIAAIAWNNEGLDGGPKITNGIKHDFPFSYRQDPGFLERGFKFRKGGSFS